MAETDTRRIEEQAETYVRKLRDAERQINRVIVGHRGLIEEIFACLLSGGHALLEGVPGLGKTMLIRAFGETMDLQATRVQFTPDLMPADILGTNTLVQDDLGNQQITFRRGPIFTQILLADEINRATPKTQSALLEAMQEQRVTISGTTYPLRLPFIVLATQNPLELEGTYPLPEAQLDRFFFKLHVDYPDRGELMQILNRTTGNQDLHVEQTLSAEEVTEMQHFIRSIVASEDIKRYAVRLVYATHPDDPAAPERVHRFVRYGAGPRGAQSLILAGKVFALLEGRFHVAYEDLRRAAYPSLRHRIVLNFRGEAEGLTSDAIVEELLDAIPEKET
ncbi:MAG: AAA family ATPase [bacterium]